MIELNDISHAWPDGGDALIDVNLRIDKGERAVLLGVNGCGKSTLLKILGGLVFPQRGDYRFEGAVIDQARLRTRACARDFRKRVVLLFQNPDAMLFNPSVRDEIAYGPRQLGLDDADARAERWAAELGISGLLDKAPFSLSGGQKQRVCLAALLALEPDLLLLDEPTANLDPRSTGWLIDFLLDLPVTTVVSTHNLSLAPEFGRRCLILGEDHRLLHDGPIDAALHDADLLWRANLVHRHRHRHGDVEHSHTHVHDWG